MKPLFSLAAVAALAVPVAAFAQQMPEMPGMEHHQHHGGGMGTSPPGQADHASHMHDVGAQGGTYALGVMLGMGGGRVVLKK